MNLRHQVFNCDPKNSRDTTSEPKVSVRNRRHTTGDIDSSDDTLDTSGEEDNKDVSTNQLSPE